MVSFRLKVLMGFILLDKVLQKNRDEAGVEETGVGVGVFSLMAIPKFFTSLLWGM